MVLKITDHDAVLSGMSSRPDLEDVETAVEKFDIALLKEKFEVFKPELNEILKKITDKYSENLINKKIEAIEEGIEEDPSDRHGLKPFLIVMKNIQERYRSVPDTFLDIRHPYNRRGTENPKNVEQVTNLDFKKLDVYVRYLPDVDADGIEDNWIRLGFIGVQKVGEFNFDELQVSKRQALLLELALEFEGIEYGLSQMEDYNTAINFVEAGGYETEGAGQICNWQELSKKAGVQIYGLSNMKSNRLMLKKANLRGLIRISTWLALLK